jgi:glyoxylase-like metal-dependent hydrolase (beta-lactamase superfamily II)
MKLKFAIATLFAAALFARGQKFTLHVHTGKGQVGYDVNSTMISGDKDMLVIDPQFSLSEAHKLAAEILESKKNLTLIYITHPHPDHMFGLAVLHQAFPQAKIVAPRLRRSRSGFRHLLHREMFSEKSPHYRSES